MRGLSRVPTDEASRAVGSLRFWTLKGELPQVHRHRAFRFPSVRSPSGLGAFFRKHSPASPALTPPSPCLRLLFLRRASGSSSAACTRSKEPFQLRSVNLSLEERGRVIPVAAVREQGDDHLPCILRLFRRARSPRAGRRQRRCRSGCPPSSPGALTPRRRPPRRF